MNTAGPEYARGDMLDPSSGLPAFDTWQALAAPWSRLDGDPAGAAHVVARREVTARLARAALADRVGRRIPALLDAAALRAALADEAEGLDPTQPLAEAVARWALGCDVECAPPARQPDAVLQLARLAGVLLRAGRIVLVLDGLTDVDAHGAVLEREEARRVLALCRRSGVVSLLLVGRAATGPLPDRRPVLARDTLLRQAGVAACWLYPPDGPVHPLLGPMRAALTDPQGPAWSRSMALRDAADVRAGAGAAGLSEEERLRLALEYYGASGSDDPDAAALRALRRTVRVLPHLGAVGEPERWRDEEFAERLALGRHGLVVLDDAARAADVGKSTLLVAELARAWVAGRPALPLSLADLAVWPPADTRRATLLDQALDALAPRFPELSADPLLAELLTELGVTLLIDDFEQVQAHLWGRFAALAGPLADALRGGQPGVRVVLAARALEPPLDADPAGGFEAGHPAVRLRQALGAGVDGPRVAMLEPVALEDAYHFLRRAGLDPDAPAEVLGDAAADLLGNPLLLELLARHGATPAEHAWEIIDWTLDRALETSPGVGAAMAPCLRNMVSGELATDAQRAVARAVVEDLALLAAAIPADGGVPRDVAHRAVEMRLLRHADRGLAEAARHLVGWLLEGTRAVVAEDRDRMLANAVAIVQGDVRRTAGAAAPALLDALCAAAGVLTADGAGVRFVHSDVRDILASSGLLRVEREEPGELDAAVTRVQWSVAWRLWRYRGYGELDAAVVRFLATREIATALRQLCRGPVPSPGSRVEATRNACARALAARDPAALAGALRPLLAGPPDCALAAVRALCAAAPELERWPDQPGRSLQHGIVPLLRADDTRVQRAAAEALRTFAPRFAAHSPRWFWRVIADLGAHPSPDVRREAAAAVATLPGALLARRANRLAAHLDLLLADPAPGVRSAGLDLLVGLVKAAPRRAGRLGGRVGALVEEPAAEVRRRIPFVLERLVIAAPETMAAPAAEVARALVADDDADVAAGACEIVPALACALPAARRAALGVALRAARDGYPDPAVRRAARTALAAVAGA